MPALEYFLVAESVSVDQTTNQVSIFNILDGLEAANFPVVIPQLAAICAWNVSPQEIGHEFKATLRVRTPGQPERDHPMNFLATHRHQRMIARLIGLPIAQAGELVFEVLLEGEHRAGHTVLVLAATPAPPAA